jgi:hypothetical protein
MFRNDQAVESERNGASYDRAEVLRVGDFVECNQGRRAVGPGDYLFDFDELIVVRQRNHSLMSNAVAQTIELRTVPVGDGDSESVCGFPDLRVWALRFREYPEDPRVSSQGLEHGSPTSEHSCHLESASAT